MAELLLGLLAGIVLASRWGMTGVEALVVAAAVAIGLYLLSCACWPFRRCWVCQSDDRRDDGRGNYRRARCWWCGSVKDHLRVGARILGRGER